MNDRTESTGDTGAEPPLAPPPPPPPPVALESESTVRSGGVSGRVAAGALGLALLVGGVAFAATQMGTGGGASDPEAAVRDMFDAIADEDVLGVLATIDPDERDVISEPVEQLFAELERLEVLDESFELSGIDGIDLEFEDLAFRTETVRDDLVRVHLTGGTASYAVDTDEMPIGDFLADALDRFGVEYRGIQESGSDALDPDEVGDAFVVARDTGDGWSISLGYTAVEAARRSMGAPVPAAGAGLAPIGADSPEAAVAGFLQAAVDIDIEGALARLSPAELRAVHDYWPVLVGDADLPTREDVEADIELTDLELRSDTGGDRGRVFIDSIGVDVVAEDFSGGGTLVDGCVEVRGDVRDTFGEEGFDLPVGPICPEDFEEIFEDATAGTGAYPFGFGGLGGLGIGGGETPELAITVVRIDGGWFVAPLGTVADLGLAVLETLEREDLDAMVDMVEELFGGFEGTVGGGYVPGDVGDLDEYEYDADTSTEIFEDFGDPIHGEEPAEAEVDALLEEMLRYLTADAVMAECVLLELRATATPDQVYELVDAFQFEYEPSPETQDVLFTALTACGG